MLQVSATVHLTWPQSQWTVHLIDVSRSGVAFASALPLEFGTSFVLSFSLPSADQPCSVLGNVVYCGDAGRSGLYRVGARLMRMSPETQELILDFVTSPVTPPPCRDESGNTSR